MPSSLRPCCWGYPHDGRGSPGWGAGLVAGITFSAVAQLSGLRLPLGIHAGLAALVLNVAVLLVAGLFAPRPDTLRLERFERMLAE